MQIAKNICLNPHPTVVHQLAQQLAQDIEKAKLYIDLDYYHLLLIEKSDEDKENAE